MVSNLCYAWGKKAKEGDPMHRQRIHKMVLTALFMALCCVATMVIQIPSPMQGYVNLGDCMVLLAGWILGPWWGMAAAGVGSALADILLAYAHYAPGTLLIKGTMALLCALTASKGGMVRRLLGGIAAEILMVAGYFVYAGLLLGNGLAAAASIPGNAVQGAVGVTAAVLLYALLEKSGSLRILKKAGLNV